MAKRKRVNESTSTPFKKRKPAKLKPPFEELPEDYWPISAVVGEKISKGQTYYLVEWVPDRKTGERYPLDWTIDSDVTEEAINEWNHYKAEQRLKPLRNNEELVRPEYRSVNSKGPRIKARRAILSSPTTQEVASTQETESCRGILEPETPVRRNPRHQTGSNSQEILETQSESCRKIGSVEVIVTQLPQSRKSSFITLPEDWGSQIPGCEEPSLGRKSQAFVSREIGIITASPPLAFRESEQTIPDSQSLHQPISPATTSSESQLFDTSRSAREDSISTGIASDSEIISHLQPATADNSASANNSAPSTQQEPIPSIEADEAVSESFQTQIPDTPPRIVEGSGKDNQVSNAMDEYVDANSVLQSTEQASENESSANSIGAPGGEGNSRSKTPINKMMPSIDKKQTMLPLLGPLEYVVPLPVEGKMRDLYLEAIKLKENDIAKFLAADRKPSTSLVETMTSFIEQLGLATAHTDYVIQESMTQSDVPASQEAIWDDYASTKYAFLGHTLDSLRESATSIQIIARSPRVRQGLATYCRGKRVGYIVLGDDPMPSSADDYSEAPLKVLISSPIDIAPLPLDLIIVFEASDVVRSGIIDQSHNQQGRTIPLVHLTVKNSPEHAALCLPKDTPPLEILKALVKEVIASRRMLGKIDFGNDVDFSHYTDYNERIQAIKKDYNSKILMTAKAVVQALSEKDFDAGWPFPHIPFDVVPDFQPPPPPPQSVRTSSPASRVGTPLGQKRTLDIGDGSGVKRQRMTPLHDVTHISNSVNDSQSQLDTLKEELRQAQQSLAKEREERAVEISDLKASVEGTLVKLEETSMELRKLQLRYETRTREVYTSRRQIKKFEVDKEADAARRAKLMADNGTLKEEKRKLQTELSEVRSALKEGGGTAAEIEIAKEQVRQLEKEKSTIEKSYNNMKKDFEFVRQQYQNASTAAAESASQVQGLEEEINHLKIAASDEKRKLKETNFTNDRDRYLNHISQEQALSFSLNAQLQRKDDELRTMRRGRGVQTRANSVQPGSPRLGGIGPGSRGSSPVPGLLSVGRMSALRHER
ncbi:hypothetical protein UCRPC4_g06061 [Phaeomoniella chlamydospora]|uniref:Spindle assembly checkpoint component MAD1 n=1 Tax=Phaeomoniella chlamydospora TaxID=158046 RepID=A0A0G2GFX0_PHACM|nr:hypothetical protein UCRPC4_g06061 [Phaeomoniella chlamydospora]